MVDLSVVRSVSDTPSLADLQRLLAPSVLARLIPTRRALHVDRMAAIRAEQLSLGLGDAIVVRVGDSLSSGLAHRDVLLQ